MTFVTVAITVETPQEINHAIELARAESDRGATMVEWRIDVLAQTTDAIESVVLLVKNSPLPCIVTIRSADEGGEYRGDEQARLDLLLAICKLSIAPAFIDIELAAFQRSASFQKDFALAQVAAQVANTIFPRLILSAHDFQSRPADLFKRVTAMWSEPLCAIAKIAWRARSVRDNMEAFELLRTKSKPTVALCMGPFGIASRVLTAKFGGFLTYARAQDELGTAPGQPTVQELFNLYRCAKISTNTSVFGVVGWPVEHSLSPLLHNSAFTSLQIDGAYVPLAIPPEWEHFKASVGEMFASPILNLRGLSVTLPHKEHALRWCKEIGGTVDTISDWCGSSNTLCANSQGAITATNTDAPAAVAALAGALSIHAEHSARLASGCVNENDAALRLVHDQWSKQRVLVLGAGGVARSVIAGLALAGAQVFIANRTHEKALQIAKKLNGRNVSSFQNSCVSALTLSDVAQPHDAHSTNAYTAIVNCTSAGMMAGGFESLDPLPSSFQLDSTTVVMDTVYRPRETPLLKRARASGCVAIDGTEMFLRQAAMQFQIFTGTTAPLALWTKLLERKLSERS